MNKNFEFWKKLAFILLGLSIPLSAINGMAGAAPFGLGVALCVHLLLALSRAEKLLKKSKTCLRVTKRKLLQDRPVVGVPVDELIFLTWAGENSLDLCLLETLPLAGFEYSASVKHCLYLFPGKGKLVQNKLCCHTAGRMSLGQIRVIISDDWGVFELVRSLEAPFQPIFYPPVYMKMQLSPQTAMGLSPAMGIHRLSRAGEGAELHEIRDYHPGDSYRKMLWSATARTGRLIVREFAAEVNIPVVFVLNTSWFLRFGSPKMMFDQLVETAMVLANATHEAGDPFGFCLYGDYDIPTRFACQLPVRTQQQISEMMKSLLQIRAHRAPTPMLNLPELEKEISKLLNGRAESFRNYCDSSTIANELVNQGLVPKGLNLQDRSQYAALLAMLADQHGLPTPILHSHFRECNSVEQKLECEEVQRLDKLLSRLVPMIKGKALIVVATRPYESNEATSRLCRVLSLIPRRSHRLLVLSPDYPSYTKQSASIPKNSEACLKALEKNVWWPNPAVITALDFYLRREKLRRMVIHLGGGFEDIDAKKNIQFIIDMINRIRYPQGGQNYA